MKTTAVRPVRIYADTSVFGGVFDDEFREASGAFFRQVQEGRFRLVISAVVRRELSGAPLRVRKLYTDMLPEAEIVEVGEDAVRLVAAYLRAGIVSPKWSDDALHVALATVSHCSAIVSWNFRHIVHFDKIPMYNAVNEVNGYRPVAIYSPSEVITYEDEEI